MPKYTTWKQYYKTKTVTSLRARLRMIKKSKMSEMNKKKTILKKIKAMGTGRPGKVLSNKLFDRNENIKEYNIDIRDLSNELKRRMKT